ncbi:DUF4192 domain-containing protein [Kineosporiaceae bacterium SCSIO 59966]|nr:DUF4192 domain-containing protein [Kineosporiaceae bacterium SCSIO 59966]
MERTVWRASEPRDLIVYAQYAVGYRPRQSVVVLCLGPGGRRVGAVGRFDLVPDDVPGAIEAQSDAVALVARTGQAAAVAVVVFTDDDLPADLLPAVRERLAVDGVPLLDAWAVGGTRYRCLTCDDDCCPPDGWPVEELADGALAAELVLDGRVLLDRRCDVVADLTPAADADARDVAGRLADAPPAGRSVADASHRGAALDTWLRMLDREPDRASSLEVAEVLQAMETAAVRDAVILTAVPGTRKAARSLATGSAFSVGDDGALLPDHDVGVALDAVFGGAGTIGGPPVHPDHERVARIEAHLRRLVRLAPPRYRRAPMGVLAWLAWWTGRGVLADEVLKLLEAEHPGDTLGELIRVAVDRGLPPPWAQPAGGLAEPPAC